MLDRFMRVAHPLPRRRGNVAARQPHVRQRPAVDVPHGSPVEGTAGVPRQVGHRLPAVQPPVQERRDRAPVRGIAGEADQRGGISATPDFLFSFSCFRALSHAARFHGSTGFFGGSPYSGRMNV